MTNNRSRLGVLALAAVLCLAPTHATRASPGAHGPNGEHLDGPAVQATAGSSQPRFEAHSELFEIVGRLEPGALRFFVGRYESNEAVLGAQVELEAGAIKTVATFLPELGSYAVSDKALLATLAQAGRHTLLLTVTAGQESDLLDAQLAVAAIPVGPDTPRSAYGKAAWPAGAVVLMALAGLALQHRRRRAAGRQGVAA